jgi:hypothetical protein
MQLRLGEHISFNLEQNYDIPVAPIIAYTMEAVAKTYPRALVLPIIYTPNPVIGVSPETLKKNAPRQ